jgi:hypothetical protein
MQNILIVISQSLETLSSRGTQYRINSPIGEPCKSKTMKYLKKIIIVIPLFLYSCAISPYPKTYEPINVFLETQKLDKNRKYILQSNKEDNKQALRIFNGEKGIKHPFDPTDPVDYTDGLFIEKHWKIMYKKYSNDTIKKHWKKEDFPNFNFALEKGTGLGLSYSIAEKYRNTGIHEIIIISEPMYYMNKKYIMFYFNKSSFEGSSSSKVVIMKKEKGNWVIVRVMGDYIFS